MSSREACHHRAAPRAARWCHVPLLHMRTRGPPCGVTGPRSSLDLHATYISGPTLGDDHPPLLQYERDPPFWVACDCFTTVN